MTERLDPHRNTESRRDFLRVLAALPVVSVLAPEANAEQIKVESPPHIKAPASGETGGIYGKRPPIPEAEPFASPTLFNFNPLPLRLYEFSLADVSLDKGPLLDARNWNRNYMLRLEVDRLLHCFRITANIPSDAKPLGGWESPTAELRGHFVGHYLSACGLHYASTGDREIKLRGDAIVSGIAECQEKLNSGGYVSAFPESLFTRLDQRKPVWAPFYTLHKIMAGLLDMAEHARNPQALDVLLKLAAWVDLWTEARSEEHMQAILETEYGGMNEVLYNLSAVTKNIRWARAGDRFTKKKFFNPLGMRRDELSKLHANTHMPQVVGAARRFELSSDYRFSDVADFFFDTVSSVRTYATGGSSNNEVWQTQPNHLSLEFKAATHHQECCCAYNMMKLVRHLYGWKPEIRYVDYYERNLYNHRLGMIQPETGLTSYFLSMTPGAWKTLCTEDETFWCCTGSALEEYAGLSSSIYAHDETGIYVNLFVASRLQWSARGIRLRQITAFPKEGKTVITIDATPTAKWSLRVRIPSWTTEECAVSINGRPLEAIASPGSYMSIQRRWRVGDTVVITMPMVVVAEPLQDDPKWQAFVYGPIVLAGQFPLGDLGEKLLRKNQGPEIREAPLDVPSLSIKSGSIQDVLKPVPGQPLHFTLVDSQKNISMKPINESWGRFSVYWRVDGPIEQNHS